MAGFQRLLAEARVKVGAAPAEEAEEARGVEKGCEAMLGSPTTLEQIAQRFALTGFERDILLLLAGLELDTPFATSLHQLMTDRTQGQVNAFTFASALALLLEPHWSALGPESPLRYWRLIDMSAGYSLVNAPLRLEESVLHALCGAPHLDDRLLDLVTPLATTVPQSVSLANAAEQLSEALSSPVHPGNPPTVLLLGPPSEDKRAVAGAAATRCGLARTVALPLELLPAAAGDLESLVRLWGREAALHDLLLYIETSEDGLEAARLVTLQRFAARNRAPLAIGVTDKIRLPGVTPRNVTVSSPSPEEQRALWERTLGPAAYLLNGHLDQLVLQFPLPAAAITATAAEVSESLASLDPNVTPIDGDVAFHFAWQACRGRGRQRIAELARPIVPRVTWDDLVLPELPLLTLRQIAAEVRQRHRVYGEWGFGGSGARGLGVSALFAGPSGTGKTLAAEVLASDLGLDLYQIDLSTVVSKYIGETEKNLRRLFDAAEESGAILLFDEADALFGKRSEVKDSHDRYANIEVGYLLQRMEAYRGLAILTTNLKNNLDAAFLRRLRHIVHFPFPDEKQRAEIWKRVFPEATPRENVMPAKLAKLMVPGGHIRNIALTASFLAADESGTVGMEHLLRAARAEFAKLEKPMNETEVAGWV